MNEFPEEFADLPVVNGRITVPASEGSNSIIWQLVTLEWVMAHRNHREMYRLYDDGTESMIQADDSEESLLAHLNAGGLLAYDFIPDEFVVK